MTYNKIYKIILSTFIIALLGETIAYNFIGQIFMYISFAVIIFLILINKVEIAFILYLLLSINISEFARDTSTNIFNLRTVDILGVSMGIILNCLFFIVFLIKNFFNNKTKKVNTISLYFLSLFFIYILISIVNLSLGNTQFKYFIEDFIYLFTIISFVYISKNLKSKLDILYIIFTAFIFRPIIIVLNIIFGFGDGMYGGLKVFSYDTLDFFIALIPILIFYYKKLIFPKWIIFLSLCSSVFVLSTQPSGKTFVLLPMGLLLLFFFSYYKKFNPLKIIVHLVTIVLLTSFAMNFINQNESQLFQEKFKQFISLAQLTSLNDNSLNSIADSPRIRILQTVNITGDLINDMPLEIIIGKGFGGSYTDNIIYMSDLDEASFSKDEINTRNFSGTHTSFNYILLKHGLLGLCLATFLLYKLFKLAINNNNFLSVFLIILAICWLLIFVGYSMKLTIIFSVLIPILLGKDKDYEVEILTRNRFVAQVNINAN
jgi:hypothetical protein